MLVEGDAKKSAQQWMGITDGGITVVWEKATRPMSPGDVVSISVNDATATTLLGTPAGEDERA